MQINNPLFYISFLQIENRNGDGLEHAENECLWMHINNTYFCISFLKIENRMEHAKNECFWIHINNPQFCFAEFVLQCAAVCCSVLQRDAACCSVWQCVAVCCSKSSSPPVSPQAAPPSPPPLLALRGVTSHGTVALALSLFL